MTLYREQIKLNNESISKAITGAVEAYERAAKKRSCNTTKLALSIEEILLHSRECYGEDENCMVAVVKSFGKIYVEFHHKGIQNNPIPNDNQEDVTISILSRLDVIPKYTYRGRNRDNIVSIVAEQKPRKNQMIISILLAVALAFVCHAIMGLLPLATQSAIASDIVAPLFSKLMAVITTVATPLVFFGILNGIVEIGDVRSLGLIFESLSRRSSRRSSRDSF